MWLPRISLAVALAMVATTLAAAPQLRVDQVGYLPVEAKLAVVRSDVDLRGTAFTIVARRDGSVAFSGTLSNSTGAYSGAAFHNRADFSALTAPGVYRLRLATGEESYPFRIAEDCFSRLPQLILRHLRSQRCGDDEPLLHGPCHLDDGLVRDGPAAGTHRDMSGGWHDAGDYLKFGGTSSYTTYVLLATHERAPEACGDDDADGTPDVLEEARHGLDWLEKLWDPANDVLYTQVGGIEDHDEGWRMPEDDALTNRPVFSCAPGAGANIAGKIAASMVLASRIWSAPTPYRDDAAAARWRTIAEELFVFGEANPGVEAGRPTWLYGEDGSDEDMELAAAELHRLTGDAAYLDAARAHATAAGPSWWFNWSAENALAHRVLASVEPDAARRATLVSYMTDDLDSFETTARGNPLHVAVPYVWGSADAQMGASMVSQLYHEASGDASHDAMGFDQLHYVLGTNQWSTCWLVGAGSDFPDDIHNQIDFLRGTQITGAFAEGGITRADFAAEGIVLDAPDEYAAFQSATAVYHDDTQDYTTNEPTIAGDCALLYVLATRHAPDRTLLMVRKDPAAPQGAALSWTGVSASYDVVRSDVPRGLDDDANLVLRDTDGLAWTDAGPTAPLLTCWSVTGAR